MILFLKPFAWCFNCIKVLRGKQLSFKVDIDSFFLFLNQTGFIAITHTQDDSMIFY